MNTSQTIGELAKALAAAQVEMKNPKLDGTNPHFRSKYASLAGVRDAVIPVLAKHGISLVQELTTEEVNDAVAVGCLTRLSHSSGEWMELGPFMVPVQKADAHGLGAASTYARRFSLQTVAGVVGDEDDDGNAASGKGGHKDDDFPPTSGPIGKAPARSKGAPQAAGQPTAPSAAPWRPEPAQQADMVTSLQALRAKLGKGADGKVDEAIGKTKVREILEAGGAIDLRAAGFGMEREPWLALLAKVKGLLAAQP